MAPGYLSTLCRPVSGVSGRRQHLCPADRNHLDFPRVRQATHSGRAFVVPAIVVIIIKRLTLL